MQIAVEGNNDSVMFVKFPQNPACDARNFLDETLQVNLTA